MIVEESIAFLSPSPIEWSAEENKCFESALAVYDKDTPDRWERVAAMLPGKTADDVFSQYKLLLADVSSIEAGLVPIPGYGASTFTLDWASDSYRQSPFSLGTGKRTSSGRSSDHERKKGVPWTEEEHRLFLMGLDKYGKGDWRNIARNFVITRTPTQVASHAQKYFIRQLSGGKDKRRASIHDITTVNLADTSLADDKLPPTDFPTLTSVTQFQANQNLSVSGQSFLSSRGTVFMDSPHEMEIKTHKVSKRVPYGTFMEPQPEDFHIPSSNHH